jgi:phage gp45-like
VLSASGKGIRNVRITLTDSSGSTRTALSTTFGYYRFDNVAAGETYIITAKGKRYEFSQPVQVINVNEDTVDINFTANP